MKRSATLPLAQALLRTLIVLNWLLAALIALLLLASFLASAWTWRALGVGGAAGHDELITGMRAIMVIGIAGAPIAWLILSRLLRIVESVRAGDAFRTGNAERLKMIAWALLALQALHLAVLAIASAVSTTDVPLRMSDDFDVAPWLAILLLFVLAQVFLEGTRMRDDLEGTV